MDGYLGAWLGLALRWLHVVAAIAWIGESFYFVMLDLSLEKPIDPEASRRGVFGELWAIHGGGFYNSQKYLLAPPLMPAHLHWSKWKAYSTWLSGFALFTALYLSQPDTFLVDPQVLPMSGFTADLLALGFLALGWFVYDALCHALSGRERLLGLLIGGFVVLLAVGATHVFSGRAAFLIVGATLATMMAANVFFVIIPGQRTMVAALSRGEVPDPLPGRQGKQRSVHNTYFTLPVVFTMISNHYAMTYSGRWAWLVLCLLMLSGALIRQFFVLRHTGRQNYAYPAAGVVLAGAAMVWAMPAPVAVPVGAAPTLADIQPIITARCVPCHAAHPALMAAAPLGIMYDTADEIETYAPRIFQQAVQLKAMPLGNATGITGAERAQIGAWFVGGAKM